MIPLLASFLPVSGELGREAAFALRDALLPVAYILALAGFYWQVARNGDNWQAHFENITLTALLVIVLSNWAAITQTLDSVSESITGIARQKMDTNQQVRLLTILASAAIQAPSGSLLANFDPWALLDAFAYQGVQFAQRIAIFAQMFLSWIQQFALNGLFAVSPLLLGFLMLPWTRQIATNFIFTTVAVALWDLGFALVDVIIFQFQDALLDFLRATGVLIPAPSQLATGAQIIAAPGRWPLFFAGFGALVLFNILLYFAAPVFVSLLLRGANPNAGAFAVMRQAAQAGRSLMAAASSATGSVRAAEAVAAQVQAAQATTQAGIAHAQAMSAYQQGGCSGAAPAPFAPGTAGGAGSVPPPPGIVQLPGLSAGGSGAMPMSAVQIDADHFRVTDAGGGSTIHNGNAADPQERQAAFTAHQVQAAANMPQPIATQSTNSI